MTARRRGRACAEVILVLGVLVVSIGYVLVPLVMHANLISSGVRCRNNLRRIGLAAREYADAQGAFPHVGARETLQGGVESGDGPRALRALVWHGGLAEPEVFICPSSYDMAIAVDELSPRLWRWGEGAGNADVSPLGSDGVVETPLRDSTALSYGWTRRGLGRDAPGGAPLAADRSCRVPEEPTSGSVTTGFAIDGGNHGDGLNVLSADGSVAWVYADEEEAALLPSIDAGGGALGIAPVRGDPDEIASSRSQGLRNDAGRLRLASAFLPACLVVAALAVRKRRRARAADP